MRIAPGVYLARLLEKEPAQIPPFDEIATLAKQNLKRRRGDDALRRYLDELRAETPVSINEEIFSPDGAIATP